MTPTLNTDKGQKQGLLSIFFRTRDQQAQKAVTDWAASCQSLTERVELLLARLQSAFEGTEWVGETALREERLYADGTECLLLVGSCLNVGDEARKMLRPTGFARFKNFFLGSQGRAVLQLFDDPSSYDGSGLPEWATPFWVARASKASPLSPIAPSQATTRISQLLDSTILELAHFQEDMERGQEDLDALQEEANALAARLAAPGEPAFTSLALLIDRAMMASASPENLVEDYKKKIALDFVGAQRQLQAARDLLQWATAILDEMELALPTLQKQRQQVKELEEKLRGGSDGWLDHNFQAFAAAVSECDTPAEAKALSTLQKQRKDELANASTCLQACIDLQFQLQGLPEQTQAAREKVATALRNQGFFQTGTVESLLPQETEWLKTGIPEMTKQLSLCWTEGGLPAVESAVKEARAFLAEQSARLDKYHAAVVEFPLLAAVFRKRQATMREQMKTTYEPLRQKLLAEYAGSALSKATGLGVEASMSQADSLLQEGDRRITELEGIYAEGDVKRASRGLQEKPHKDPAKCFSMLEEAQHTLRAQEAVNQNEWGRLKAEAELCKKQAASPGVEDSSRRQADLSPLLVEEGKLLTAVPRDPYAGKEACQRVASALLEAQKLVQGDLDAYQKILTRIPALKKRIQALTQEVAAWQQRELPSKQAFAFPWKISERPVPPDVAGLQANLTFIKEQIGQAEKNVSHPPYGQAKIPLDFAESRLNETELGLAAKRTELEERLAVRERDLQAVAMGVKKSCDAVAQELARLEERKNELIARKDLRSRHVDFTMAPHSFEGSRWKCESASAKYKKADGLLRQPQGFKNVSEARKTLNEATTESAEALVTMNSIAAEIQKKFIQAVAARDQSIPDEKAHRIRGEWADVQFALSRGKNEITVRLGNTAETVQVRRGSTSTDVTLAKGAPPNERSYTRFLVNGDILSKSYVRKGSNGTTLEQQQVTINFDDVASAVATVDPAWLARLD